MESENYKRRVFWIDEEVETMLAIIKDKDILRQLDGKTRRNNRVYKRISEDLRRKKFYKTSVQVKTKLRFLKKNYFDVKRNNSKPCLYFEQLDELYGTRAEVSSIGVDTTTDDETGENMASDVKYLQPYCEFEPEPEIDPFTFAKDEISIRKTKMEIESDKKRVFWIDEEVETMLAILKEKGILRQLDGKTRRNNSVYKRISEVLNRKKYYKSSVQVKTKLRFLKKNYFDVKRNNSKSCPYFEQLDELYGTRAAASAVEADSSTDEERGETKFSDVKYLHPYCELEPETENDAFTAKDDSSTSMPSQNQAPEKISLPQALAKMTEDVKEGFDRLIEQNTIFLREQRNMNSEFMRNMQQMMEDNRKTTEKFLERLLNYK